MPAKTFHFLLLITTILTGEASKAQFITTPVSFTKEPVGITSFTKHWAYPWYIIKHNDGSFENTTGEGIEDADTTHFFFTANCRTNLQGGALLNYCQIYRTRDSIVIAFHNQTGAFVSEFYTVVSKGKFHFVPKIIREDLTINEAATYNVLSQKLILYQKNYAEAKFISGYIDVEFRETIQTQSRKYYFRGYFDAPAKP